MTTFTPCPGDCGEPTAKRYLCTKCGWSGTDPKPLSARDDTQFCCPRCPYTVMELPQGKQPTALEMLKVYIDDIFKNFSLYCDGNQNWKIGDTLRSRLVADEAALKTARNDALNEVEKYCKKYFEKLISDDDTKIYAFVVKIIETKVSAMKGKS